MPADALPPSMLRRLVLLALLAAAVAAPATAIPEIPRDKLPPSLVCIYVDLTILPNAGLEDCTKVVLLLASNATQQAGASSVVGCLYAGPLTSVEECEAALVAFRDGLLDQLP